MSLAGRRLMAGKKHLKEHQLFETAFFSIASPLKNQSTGKGVRPFEEHP